MDETSKILSDVIVHMKYAKFIKEHSRREVWKEITERNKNMHLKKYPALRYMIDAAYKYVYDYKVLPSMRSMQFGGKPIELANNRIFNCAYMPIDDMDFFSELMFLLLGGTGLGFSVQWRHVSKLPVVRGCKAQTRKFLVGDSIEGWADAIKVLVESHFLGKERVVFDLSDIREKGKELVTSGGKAPGPEPLRQCLYVVDLILRKYRGTKLSTVACYDIACYIADAVLAGGIRRAAMICLFDKDDIGMLRSKSGEWWHDNPQRARSNNSIVLKRGEVTIDEFYDIFRMIEENNTGDPGIYWTNDKDWGTNPCVETGLRPYQFCNLTDINASNLTSEEDFYERCKAAAIIGTLQSGYTDFHYLRPIWKETAESEYIIGVGQTGIASMDVPDEWLQKGAKFVEEVNKIVSKEMGVKPAVRLTTVKPAGTSSLALGCSSGIHSWHDYYYVRRITIMRSEPIFKYLMEVVPELMEDSLTDSKVCYLTVPQKAPEAAVTRNESMLDLLERVKKYNTKWVKPGHIEGENSHNVSCTISVRDNEWSDLTAWMWTNRNTYNGMAILPFYGGNAQQTPFETVTKERYEYLVKFTKMLNLKDVIEEQDNTDLTGEIACGGHGCEIK